MLNLSAQQHSQLKKFDNCFVEYPNISEIYTIFDRLRFNKSLGGEPESFLLTGETGSGKTALINHYLARFEDKTRWADQAILNTRIPSQVKEQNMLTQFLIDLASKSCGRSLKRRNDIALASAVVRELRQKSTELVIVNEIQELVEFSTPKDRQAIANTFKFISEEAGVSFVLVGMPYASLIAEEPQWNSRLSWRREVSYFKLLKQIKSPPNKPAQYEIDAEQKKHFGQFLAGLASRMGYSQAPKLTTNELLYPLFSMCSGECRKLKHFLRDAMLTGFNEGKDTLDRSILLKTFALKYPYLDNPFFCPLEDIKLNQITTNSTYNTQALSPEEKILPPHFTDILPLSMLLTKRNGLILS